MSIIKKIESIFLKKWEPGNRTIIYYDKDWRLLSTDIEFTEDQRKNKELLKKLEVQKIIKAINLKKLWIVISKFRVNTKFLLHFFELMEQQEENVEGKVNFDLTRIFERLQTQDIQYFEFYRYVWSELLKGKRIGEIIRTIKWFENYVEFFEMLDSLKEKDRSKLFWKLKDKILKEQHIKTSIVKPLVQPIIMVFIIGSIFIWFANWMLKDLIASFVYLWYSDRIPNIVMLVYNIWMFLKNNLILIAFFITAFSIFVLGALNIKKIKDYLDRLLFDITFYKYFNELFIAYFINLQADNEKKWLRDLFYDLRKSFEHSNKYYYFVFDLIYKNIEIAAEKYIPLRKYWYILSNEFISSIEQIVKSKKPALIDSYIRFVEKKIDQMLASFSSYLSTIWLVIVAGWIALLFLWILIGNNAKTNLMTMQNKGLFQAEISIPWTEKQKEFLQRKMEILDNLNK